MTFTGFDEKDGAALYDTKESAIERAEMLKAWNSDPDAKIFIHRKSVPLWFAHMVRETWFRRLAYTTFHGFETTLDTVLVETKRQFLRGAQRVVLTRDGNCVFCEPEFGS